MEEGTQGKGILSYLRGIHRKDVIGRRRGYLDRGASGQRGTWTQGYLVKRYIQN